jgi:hypothetical protein
MPLYGAFYLLHNGYICYLQESKMKIGRRFNELTKGEYLHCIENYKKYTDFNTLGLYRSITENDKLDIEDKIFIRDFANKTFEKTFNFLQLKDPKTYFDLTTLGKVLTKADERQVWDDIRENQQKILSDKRFGHRNFGDYSKHNCGHDDCYLNGLMIKKGSYFSYGEIHFKSDTNRRDRKNKSEGFKKDRKKESLIIKNELEN